MPKFRREMPAGTRRGMNSHSSEEESESVSLCAFGFGGALEPEPEVGLVVEGTRLNSSWGRKVDVRIGGGRAGAWGLV